MVLAWSKFIAWFRKLMVQRKLTLILPLLLIPKEKNMFVAQRKIWNQKSSKDCALTPGKYCMYVSDRLSSINTSCSFSLDTFLTLSRRKVTYLDLVKNFWYLDIYCYIFTVQTYKNIRYRKKIQRVDHASRDAFTVIKLLSNKGCNNLVHYLSI